MIKFRLFSNFYGFFTQKKNKKQLTSSALLQYQKKPQKTDISKSVKNGLWGNEKFNKSGVMKK